MITGFLLTGGMTNSYWEDTISQHWSVTIGFKNVKINFSINILSTPFERKPLQYELVCFFEKKKGDGKCYERQCDVRAICIGFECYMGVISVGFETNSYLRKICQLHFFCHQMCQIYSGFIMDLNSIQNGFELGEKNK